MPHNGDANMAKKNEDNGATALAERPQNETLPAAASVFGGGSRLEGADNDDLVLPVVKMFQDTSDERKRYGKDFGLGDLVLTIGEHAEKLGTRAFIPLKGWKSWIKWNEPRGTGMEYNHTVRSEVPPDDLEWKGDVPPAATESINYIVLFDGQEMPAVIRFSKTSLKSGKTLNTLESLRGKRGPGLYELGFAEKSNDQGTFAVAQVRPKGDPAEDLLLQASILFEQVSGSSVVASDEQEHGAEEGSGFDPEAF